MIVDLDLPDGGTVDLIRDLAGRRGLVTLGSSERLDCRREALAAGAAGFLERPLPDLHLFQTLIAELLPRSRQFRGLSEGDAVANPKARDSAFRHVADALRDRPKGAGPDWLCGFLSGIARQAEDPALSAACAALATPEGDLRALLALLRHRAPP